jgi:hypothetical protein
MMKQTINFNSFTDGLRSENYSYRGLELLWECLTELEDSTGFEMEFDPTAIRCTYTECLAIHLAKDYGFESEEESESDEWYSELIWWLEQEGIWFEWVDDETIIYEAF